MKCILPAVLLAWCLDPGAALAYGGRADAASVRSGAAGRPTADPILREVRARFPREPVLLSGELTVRRRRGVVVRRLGFEAAVDWGGEPPSIRYTIRDAFGADLEQLTVFHEAPGLFRVAYGAGDPPRDRIPPSLFEAVQGSDVNWLDLTLSFLWWPGAEIAGTETLRGRACRVVDVPAPAPAEGEEDDDRYAGVRLWIDKELSMLLQMEAYHSGGETVKRMWVKSLKKMGDRWMIKDMEIRSFPEAHRTRLRVRKVEEGARGEGPAFAKATAGKRGMRERNVR